MEVHPAANVYPKISKAELELLADDIRINGQRERIRLLNGKILDGRNRWDACELAGIAPKSEEIVTDQPLAYVHSYNFNHRHLTPSQRAMVAAKELEYLKRYPKEKGLEYNRIMHEQKVSSRTVKRAQRVVKSGTKKLRDDVEEGKISVREADTIAGRTPEQQAELLKKRTKRPSRKNKQAPMATAKAALRKDARLAFGQLVRSVNALGLFETLYDHLEAIRSRIEA